MPQETEQEKIARLQRELTEYVEKEQGSFDEVRLLLTNLNQQVETLDVVGIPVRMKPAFTKSTRRKMEFLIAHKNDMEVLEQTAYEIMALMSKDVPYTNPLTWQLVDEEHGIIFDLLNTLYEGIGKQEQNIASFRKRS